MVSFCLYFTRVKGSPVNLEKQQSCRTVFFSLPTRGAQGLDVTDLTLHPQISALKYVRRKRCVTSTFNFSLEYSFGRYDRLGQVYIQHTYKDTHTHRGFARYRHKYLQGQGINYFYTQAKILIQRRI